MLRMRHYPFILAAVSSILAACSQPEPPMTSPIRGTAHTGTAPREQLGQRQYLALPGQSAVRVGTADADEAFDRQVEAYGGGATAPVPPGSGAEYASPATASPVPAQDISPQPTTPVATPPVAGYDDFPTPNPSGADAASQPAAPVASAAPAAAPETAEYAVQITNGTTGRIFVEAQDAAGHIFPCGPMFGGQSINTPPDSAGELKNPITVVIRDPDKDGAPEIRRYQVQAPADYKGKTIGITILPGGQYRADIDKEIYYTSPPPAPAQDASAQ